MEADRVPNICVVGAGVIGLSSALAIKGARPDCRLTVIADKFSPYTTSDGAFGLWFPYLLRDTPIEDIRRWGERSLDYMIKLAHSENGPPSGTLLVGGYSIWKSHKPDPIWKDMVPQFRYMTEYELQIHGAEYVLKSSGVIFLNKKIADLSELRSQDYDVIINCSGLGARQLANDSNVIPASGQVIRVRAPWVKHALFSKDEGLYILPGADFVVLGGTNIEGSWNTSIDLTTKNRILKGCHHIMPNLKNAAIIEDWVGLRPSRSSVRLETEVIKTPNGPMRVVHNYGHCGAGIGLHYGCALEVAKHVQNILQTPSKL